MGNYSNPLVGTFANVGDLIMVVRSLGPDNPLTVLPPPAFVSVTPEVVAGGTIGLGTYYIQLTQLNPWGESLPSGEQTVTLAGAQNAFAVQAGPDAGSIAIRVYLGQVSGGEKNYLQFSPVNANVTNIFHVTGAVNPPALFGAPPLNPTAFVPDSDGGFVTAPTMFRWLNDALRAAARITGGIQDSVGLASHSGQRRYTALLVGQWLRFDQCFYDGWELDLGNKAETFRNRNLTANIAISLMIDTQADTTRLELYWTPSRTSGVAATTANITTTSATIPITNPTSWLLNDGFAILSDGVNAEVVSYSAQSPNQLTGCIRGWAGTVPFPFLAGATVQEANLELNGYRMPYMFTVGQSNLSLGVPPGWEPFLKEWLLGNFRMAEQETDEGKKLQDSAAKSLVEWAKSNKPVAGPRQCRIFDDRGWRGVVPGGLTGGIIIP